MQGESNTMPIAHISAVKLYRIDILSIPLTKLTICARDDILLL